MGTQTLIPKMIQIDYANPLFIVKTVAIISASIVFAAVVSKYAAERFKGRRKKVTVCTVGLTLFTALLLISIYGAGIIAVKGVIFSLILCYASYQDIRTRECDDSLALMTLICGLIGKQFASVPYMIISAVFAGGVMVVSVFLTKSEIGGADIKMAAASSFICGLTAGIAGLLLGMSIAVIINLAKKKRKKGFPMIPYLACGYMVAFVYSNMITGGI